MRLVTVSLIRLSSLFVLVCCWTSVVRAQSVVIDWTPPDRALITAPAEVNLTSRVTLAVRNVNNILYDYTVDVKGTPRSVCDFCQIVGLLPTASSGQAPAAPPGNVCKTTADTADATLQALDAAVKADAGLNPQMTVGTTKSVALADTVNAWNAKVRPNNTIQSLSDDLQTLKQNNCTDAESQNATQRINGYLTTDGKIDQSHTITKTATLEPDYDYTIVVTEYYNNLATSGGSKTYTFSPTSNILTLSAGPIFTEIQNPSYVSRPSPAPQTGNFLSVENTGPLRPGLLALLNYAPPVSWLERYNNVGLAFSTGPVLTFDGGKNSISNFGFFLGGSVHLYHRIYITPGFHFGQFPGVPPGLKPGQPIPPNITQLTPDNRWTVRFGFGITFKTTDFTKLISGSKPTTPTQPTGGKATP